MCTYVTRKCFMKGSPLRSFQRCNSGQKWSNFQGSVAWKLKDCAGLLVLKKKAVQIIGIIVVTWSTSSVTTVLWRKPVISHSGKCSILVPTKSRPPHSSRHPRLLLRLRQLFLDICDSSLPKPQNYPRQRLIDCGASQSCISERFATRHSLPRRILDVPTPILTV